MQNFDYFIETFKLARRNFRKFNYRLKEHKFSHNELLLLKAYKAYISSSKEELLTLLSKKKINETFLEATRLYLIGLCQNHFGSYQFAIEKLEKSVSLYEKSRYKEFVVYPYIVLLITYSNQKKKNKIEHYLNLLKKIKSDCDYLELSRAHAMAVGYLTLDHKLLARKVIKESFENKSSFLEVYQAGFLLIEFMLSLSENDPDKCYEILQNYKNVKGISVKANYAFMKSLMDHLYLDAPLYVYKKDFADFPELCDQLEFIKALSRKDKIKMDFYWDSLRKHNKDLYLENFIYNGDLCLFSLALKKHQSLLISNNEVKLDFKGLSISEKLERIFSTEEILISKEKMIELLWNEEVSEVTMARLRKLISRYNKNSSHKVISYQEFYKKVG